MDSPSNNVVVQEVLKADRFEIAPHAAAVPMVVIPNDRKVIGVSEIIQAHEKTQAQPYRRRGIYVAASVESLVQWMAANTEEAAPVFGAGIECPGDWRAPKLSLIGIGNYSAKDNAAWHDFRVKYDFPVTDAWKVWAAQHEKPLNQLDFAEFIENRIYDLASLGRDEEPSDAVTRFLENANGAVQATPAQIYELSRGLKITANCKLESKIDTGSGETTLRYTEEHTGAGGRPIKVPDLFYIRIPVFFGAAPSLIGVRLRYRASNSNVSWSFSLFAPDMIVTEQFDAACQVVRDADRTVYLGTPDAP